MAYAQQAIPEPTLIEFLGEFDEDDAWLLEESMTEIEQKDANASEQQETKEVSDDKNH